jgi:histidyl-tRNA synthetase
VTTDSPEPSQPERRRIVEPRTLRGFRDLLPEAAAYRTWCVERIGATFRTYGFQPMVTPALEYAEILRGKAGEDQDREMYEFRDRGGRDVGMRFDLTVPLARFVAEHMGELGLPLRLYQIGPVWRGERPQAGRYREFVQCDADILGSESPAADAEVIAMLWQALANLELRPFTIRVSDRRILAAVLEHERVEADPAAVMRALDKVERTPRDQVMASLDGLGVPAATADHLLRIVGDLADDDDTQIDHLAATVGDSTVGKLAVERLRELRSRLDDLGVPPTSVRIDPSVVRGLDYYTGVVFETSYHGAPEVGSICSGGRYDNLTLVYSKHRTPGVGGSIGIDRLLHAVLELEGAQLPPDAQGRSVVFGGASVDDQAQLFDVARQLRTSGIPVDVHPDPLTFKKLRSYAARRNSPLFVYMSEGEIRLGPPSDGPIESCAPDELAGEIRRRLEPTAAEQ